MLILRLLALYQYLVQHPTKQKHTNEIVEIDPVLLVLLSIVMEK